MLEDNASRQHLEKDWVLRPRRFPGNTPAQIWQRSGDDHDTTQSQQKLAGSGPRQMGRADVRMCGSWGAALGEQQ